MLARGFLAEVDTNCKVLVLGSMPGIISLDAAAYYANKRNAFWPIMQQLFGISLGNYQQQLSALKNEGIGLWDVYGACYREGSLDSAIQKNNAEFNDIAALIATLPQLSSIACNGLASAKAFKQLAKEQGLLLEQQGIEVLALPSSSPAYAAMSFDDKCLAWSVLSNFTGRV